MTMKYEHCIWGLTKSTFIVLKTRCKIPYLIPIEILSLDILLNPKVFHKARWGHEGY